MFAIQAVVIAVMSMGSRHGSFTGRHHKYSASWLLSKQTHVKPYVRTPVLDEATQAHLRSLSIRMLNITFQGR
jgi:hypothetical protein